MEHLLEVVVEMELLEVLVVEELLKQNQTVEEQVIHLLQIHLKVILVVMDQENNLTLQTMRQVEVVEQPLLVLMLAQELVDQVEQEHLIQF